MMLSIRDPEAHELARRLAEARGVTITEATIQALRGALAADREKIPLPERLAAIADRARGLSRPGGQDMDKDGIDRMWGHD